VGIVSLILIAFGLSFDSFAVSVCSGMSLCRKTMRFRDVLKIALSLAVFQAIMPVIGWYLGSTVKTYIEHFDHWIAFVLLAILGIRMIVEGWHPHLKKIKKPTQWRVILPMALATSIDALAVGITFAFLLDNMLVPAIIIGAVTLAVSLAGLYMGKKLGVKLAGKAEIIGGLFLIGIGAKILTEHLLGYA
jgi:manganese efflux pump family protein